MNRRQFLQRFAAVPIAASLVEPVARTIFLPPRGGWWFDPKKYLTSNTAWYLKGHSPFSNTLPDPPKLLSVEELEGMLTEMCGIRGPLAMVPNRLIVHPSWSRDDIQAWIGSEG